VDPLRTAGTGDKDSCGLDGPNGQGAEVFTDALGPLVVLKVMATSVQTRDGAETTLSMHVVAAMRFVLADARLDRPPGRLQMGCGKRK
jgi:hypothetical protein